MKNSRSHHACLDRKAGIALIWRIIVGVWLVASTNCVSSRTEFGTIHAHNERHSIPTKIKGGREVKVCPYPHKVYVVPGKKLPS